ncbi:MAG: hypothetical protein ACXIUM_13235 [Wenzhouxiangella sp.]
MTISVFLGATLIVELTGTPQAVAHVKSLIVTPGLWILIPCLALTGASGNRLARGRVGRLVSAKRKRIAFAAGNGVLILVPSALILAIWAAQGEFGSQFYAVQVVEIIAGMINLSLLGLNFRDGLRLSSRRRASAVSRTG